MSKFHGMLVGGRAPGRWVVSDQSWYRVFVSRSMPMGAEDFKGPGPEYSDVDMDVYEYDVFKYRTKDGQQQEFCYFRHVSLKNDGAVLEHLFQNYHPTISGAVS